MWERLSATVREREKEVIAGYAMEDADIKEPNSNPIFIAIQLFFFFFLLLTKKMKTISIFESPQTYGFVWKRKTLELFITFVTFNNSLLHTQSKML